MQNMNIETNKDQRPNSRADIRIVTHDVAVQLLARLDDQSYQQALEQDAKSVNENYLLPLSFPWRQGARLPKKALKAMPRDIDELHVVRKSNCRFKDAHQANLTHAISFSFSSSQTTHCDGQLHAPFGDFNGPLGFGRFENGQSRGHYGVRPLAPINSANSLSMASQSVAATRRSKDPGVVELAVQLPLPPSIDSSKQLTPNEWSDRLMRESADNAEALSHLPFSWNAKMKTKCYTEGSALSHGTEPTRSSTVTQESFAKLNENKIRVDEQRIFSMACLRKWKVSAKVEGVSTRSSLFPSPIIVNSNSTDKHRRQVVRPMLCKAILPEEIQTGKSLSIQQASELDKGGLSQRLRSYDCRFADKLINQKKDTPNKSKQVEVGRTRLIWSNLVEGCAPSTSGLVYNSLITGRRLDPSKILRPREIKVGVRLKGKLIQEEATEDVPEPTVSSSKKRKHSTRQSSESEDTERRQSIQVSELRTDDDIKDAFDFTLDGANPSQDKMLLNTSTCNGALVYLNLNPAPNSLALIDHREVITSLVKLNKHKKAKQCQADIVSSNHCTNYYTLPRFSTIYLNSESTNIVCVSSGKMPSSSVHELLCDESRAHPSLRCSICWSDQGVGQDGIHECSSCGLLVHHKCCFDVGELIPTSNGNDQHCKPAPNDVINGQSHSKGQDKWKCAVCSQYTEKSRRNARLPSRFTTDMIQEQSNQSSDSLATNAACKNIPGPRCTLCPHRGGAMSLLEPKESQQWAHEVCRIWSNPENQVNKDLGTRPFHRNSKVAINTCALCGGTGLKRGKSSCVGLTKCAVEGCFIAFHPMCALIASKLNKTRDQAVATPNNHKTGPSIEEEKKSDEDDDAVLADKELCNEYTLQLVKLPQSEATIPVAFCGLHNAGRGSSLYGRLPGGDVEE